MNAPERRTPLAEPEVALVLVDDLVPSQTHIQELRRKRFRPEAITEIAASLLKIGQLQPIVIRPNPRFPVEPKYQIVLGERRWLACQQAGLKHIQAALRPMSDGDVLEAQLVENLQREDLHPLEEAEGYRELMNAVGLKKEDLGDRIGKSRSWVYSRLKLLDLLPATRDALEAGRIDVSRALVLARIGDPIHQAKALKLAAMKDWTHKEPQYSVRELQDALGDKGYAVGLKLAPFDPADATLRNLKSRNHDPLPACVTCEFRSGNNDPAAADPDVCTNRSCYEKKLFAYGQRTLYQAKSAGRTVLQGDEAKKIAAGKDRFVGYVDLDAVCDHDEFPEAEPDDTESDAWSAWSDRERNWQPRTYRQLLAGALPAAELVLLEDKGRVRELAPFKEVQKLLKKDAAIALPSYIAQKPPAAHARVDYKAQQEKYEAERKAQEVRADRERAWRGAVLARCAKAVKSTALTFAELEYLFKRLCGDWQIREGFKHLPSDMRGAKKSEALLTKIIRMAAAAECVGHVNNPPAPLLALAKTCKVDVAGIKRELESKGGKK